uniref:Galectin n=1 Tax=Equus caballus TaxID=9796 RepID=A0A9L0T772_HORSE
LTIGRASRGRDPLGSGPVKRVGAAQDPSLGWSLPTAGAAVLRNILLCLSHGLSVPSHWARAESPSALESSEKSPRSGTAPAWGLVASNLNLKPGECLRVRGEVAPDAKSFVLNLGKDSDNLCLHFNPRFNMHGDANTIVCNSKDGGAWGTEQRESAFPFQPGSVMEVCISFDKADLTITLPDGYSFKFPNRLNLEAVNYLSANGDFKIKCVAFE